MAPARPPPKEGRCKVRRVFLLAAASLLCAGITARAQDAEAERERESVRKAVETHLYSEDVEEKKRVTYAGAKVLSVDSDGRKIRETPVSASAGKRRGAKTTRSPQKIVAIDVANNAAAVKVATEFMPADPADALPKHFQYVTLLKVNGEWKIVGILMPLTTLAKPASK